MLRLQLGSSGPPLFRRTFLPLEPLARPRASKLERTRGNKRKAASTSALMQSDQPRDIAELQWRLSRPLATILLALIAVPFSRTAPRQAKGDKTYYVAALVFAIYYILNGLAQTWVEQGAIGGMPGVWWLYLVMLLFAITLLSPGVWQRLFLRR